MFIEEEASIEYLTPWPDDDADIEGESISLREGCQVDDSVYAVQCSMQSCLTAQHQAEAWSEDYDDHVTLLLVIMTLNSLHYSQPHSITLLVVP